MKTTRFGDYEDVVTFEVWSNYRVHIVFTENIPESRKARYGTYGNSEDAGALHTRGEGGHGHLFYRPTASAEQIAHEAVHAVWTLFAWAGVEKWDNETFAYHVGHLVGRISLFQRKVLDRLGVKAGEKEKSITRVGI